MARAKQIKIIFIEKRDADRVVKQFHYSGKVTKNSQINFGVLLDGRLLGALQYGPPIDRRRAALLFEGAGIRQMLELNRLAFSDALPRNSESRSLGVTIREIAKTYPDIIWVQSFADACQCGDGTIYRAAGFSLVQIKRNTTQLVLNGRVVAKKTLDDNPNYNSAHARKDGAVPLAGHQIKYIRILRPEWANRFTGEYLPFSALRDLGIRMYRGQNLSASSETRDTSGDQPEKGGAIPTDALQPSGLCHAQKPGL